MASRSPNRPNPIGLSCVKIERIYRTNDKNAPICIEVSGHDLLEGTPILDIKPYLSYSDSIENPTHGAWASTLIPRYLRKLARALNSCSTRAPLALKPLNPC